MKFGEKPSLEVFTGYDNAIEFKKEMTSFILTCDKRNVFINMKLNAADFETANAILSIIQGAGNSYSINRNTITYTVNKIFGNSRAVTMERLTEAIVREFSVLSDNSSVTRVNETMLKNAFVRVIYTLKTVFRELIEKLDENSAIFYEGDLNKYDFITLNVLTSIGVSGKVIHLDQSAPVFLTAPLFTVIDGGKKSKIDFDFSEKPARGVSGGIQRNAGLNIAPELELADALNLLMFYIEKRTGSDFSKTLSINFRGVGDKDKYELAVNTFYLALKSKSDVFVLDENFGNPTSDEVQTFNIKNFTSKTVDTLLNQYTGLKNTAFPLAVKKAVDTVISDRKKNQNQRNNMEMIFKIWLSRICDMFKSGCKGVPTVIIWGNVSERILDFLSCLENLPIDIIQFSPTTSIGFSPNVKNFDVGPANPEKTGFPYEVRKLSGYSTVAFQAERDIRSVLSGDDTRNYQLGQFKEMNPIILKTTFEEIDIIWREPAKFRPSFSTAGDIVTIPSIFAKINGVIDNLDDYIMGIQAKITPETLLLRKFPYMQPDINPGAVDFMKKVYYNGSIDMERVKSSQYYKYSLYSQKTQNVINKGINDYIANNWYIKKRPSFIYEIMEILFRLPQKATQLIHNFSFTETIPKVVLFNATDTPCGAADSTLIMFLKSLGFDVIMYAPTGYSIVEEYIDENLFNTIDVGRYRYDLTDMDITQSFSDRRGVWKNLFTRREIL